MKKKIIYLVFLYLIFLSCKQQEEAVPIKKSEILWDKLQGKIVAFSSENVFVIDGTNKKVDTILTKPVSLQYQIYGAVGASRSANGDKIIYSVYGVSAVQPGSIYSMGLDGSNNTRAVTNIGYMLSSPSVNASGEIAYCSSEYLLGASSIWVDQKNYTHSKIIQVVLFAID
jgi:hypothetical protein